MNEGYGWNKVQVEATINNIVNIANNLNTDFQRIQPDVIIKMADCWASQDAVDFFAIVNSDLKKIEINANTIFNSTDAAIRKAVEDYQAVDKSSVALDVSTMPNFEMGVDVSVILENKDNFRGINPTLAETYRNTFIEILDETVKDLNELDGAVAESGFYGGDQQAALNESMNTVRESISKMKTDLADLFDSKINQTKSNYETIATTISTHNFHATSSN